jgi:AraC-like DNA-binding protein
MVGCGTATIADPEEYQVGVPGASINLVLTGSGDFKARLTWVNLRRLRLVRIEENLPRIAFVRFAPGPIFVSFAMRHTTPVNWNDIEMRSGQIVLHSSGERLYQRTSGKVTWGLISVAPKDLAYYGRVLARIKLTAPRSAQFLRPTLRSAGELFRLHGQACRLAKTNPDVVVHKEVARALEQELLRALVNCLNGEEAVCQQRVGKSHADIMARFEDYLVSHFRQQISIPKLCAAIDVAERTLRIRSIKSLGRSPGNYARLRRLNLVRNTLRRADPTTTTVAEVAKRYGFSQLGRFSGAYRAVFGEAPSATLCDHRSNIRETIADAGFA